MQRWKYAPEFKDEAVKQVIDKGRSVVDVAKRLGIPDNVLYTWVSKFKKAGQPEPSELKAMQAELLAFRLLAKSYAGLTAHQLGQLLINKDLLEICHDDKTEI
jgi:transposase-like protein